MDAIVQALMGLGRGMMREDCGRQLSHATLEEIRVRAVKRVEAGQSPEDVIHTLGLSRGAHFGVVDGMWGKGASGRDEPRQSLVDR
jgi:hypothetical protein